MPASLDTPAAVLIALLPGTDGPQLVLTRRTATLAKHPAEISLPGGRVEPQDETLAAAALREAFEEVGLPPQQVELLGCLPPYRTISDYRVYPFVGWVDAPVRFVPDPNEVDDVFLVPLRFVVDPANHHRGSIVHEGVTRSFFVIPYFGYRIWGATAGILIMLARTLAA